MKDFSQYGEGKIIADAVAAIEGRGDKVPMVAVEFGSGDGFTLSNIRGLMEEGWKGVQLEKEKSSNPEVLQADIDAENINSILREEVDSEIGVMSIDVDGNDWWIWRAMTAKPHIVVIEFNPTLEGRKTIRYDPGHRWTEKDNYCGASFLAIIDLGHRKGYKAVAKTACNVVFARADLWKDPVPELTHEAKPIWAVSGKEWQEV